MSPEQQPQEPSDIGKAIQDITEYSQLLIREEIELAKAEITQNVTTFIKGAVVGVVAGVFAMFGIIYFFEAAAWFVWQQTGTVNSYWLGFFIIAVVLFLIGGLAAFAAYRFLKKGSNPAPSMAIEQAQKVRQTITESGVKPSS